MSGYCCYALFALFADMLGWSSVPSVIDCDHTTYREHLSKIYKISTLFKNMYSTQEIRNFSGKRLSGIGGMLLYAAVCHTALRSAQWCCVVQGKGCSSYECRSDAV